MKFTQLTFQICMSRFFTWRIVTERIFKFLLYLKNMHTFIYLLPSKTKLAVICSTKKSEFQDFKTETTLKLVRLKGLHFFNRNIFLDRTFFSNSVLIIT